LKKAQSTVISDLPVIPANMIKKVSSKSRVETFIDTYTRFNAYQGSIC